MYDMVLASLFFFVVLSPFVINAGLNLAERNALRRAALNAGQKNDPRHAWVSDVAAGTPAVSSAAPSVQ